MTSHLSMLQAITTPVPDAANASLFLVIAFVALGAAVAAAVVVGIARVMPEARVPAAAFAIAWLAITAGVASTGVLARFDARPPPFALVVAGTLALGLGLGCSPLGRALARGLPLWVLVGFQGFRLPLELLMHRAAQEGVMPSVMSFGAGGRNFDIVTGAAAIALAAALALTARRVARAAALAWVLLAFATLLNVVLVAVAASPLFTAFGPAQLNTWIAHPPFVWLPTVLVASALAGQIVVVRALLFASRKSAHGAHA